ncbi:hypothetical protein [Pedobacter steynii]|uniref:Uncharacterized protein n=1 Tax=Pedobacter steynii TaxID=430522 RepID=A0A1D7QKT3_9SPHI|nr:hypothetical protein [Pedobacter steynii]AOM79285.1 hypothetical protein BFS30_20210 [Pedobacter steynii]
MFDELSKYKQGNFFFQATDSLVEVCNVDRNKYGLYLVYALRKGRVELIYINKSGPPEKPGLVASPGDIADDLRENLLNGYQFGEIERKNSWPVQMMIEDIEALHVHWYVTYDDKNKDLPATMKSRILQIYQGIYSCVPRWNKI